MSTLHIVMFRGQSLMCLQDGEETWVVMRPVVEGMGLSWSRQRKKLVEDLRGLEGHADAPANSGTDVSSEGDVIVTFSACVPVSY
jgi:hypothetical protein